MFEIYKADCFIHNHAMIVVTVMMIMMLSINRFYDGGRFPRHTSDMAGLLIFNVMCVTGESSW